MDRSRTVNLRNGFEKRLLVLGSLLMSFYVAARILPKTASELPLVGLLGLLYVGASLGLKRIRLGDVR